MKPETPEPSLFDLDETKLDKEWLLQPRFYHDNALKLAEARKQYEQAKATKELLIAELDQAIRKNPERYDITKLTEDSIEKTIQTQKSYVKCQRRLINKKHAVDVLQAMIDTLDHRKKALENLVQLYLADYFSEPRYPKGVQREDADRIMKKRRTQHERKETHS